jgi:hypothetical protein
MKWMAYLIWGAGLVGTLFALVYMAQYRRQNWWRTDDLWGVPRTLLPLYASLCIFCIGLALNAVTAQRSISLWMAAIWASLAMLFAQQSFATLMTALHSGWDASPGEQENGRRGRGWWAVVALLLVANLALVGWWAQTELAGGNVALNLRALLAQPGGTVSETGDGLTAGAGNEAGESGLSSIDLLATRAAQSAAMASPTATLAATPQATQEALILVPTPTPAQTPVVVAPTIPVTSTAPVTALAAPLATATTVTIASEFGANARLQPDLAAEVLTVLPLGATVPAVGRTADGQWLQVRLADERLAWMALQVITVTGQADALPVVEVGN